MSNLEELKHYMDQLHAAEDVYVASDQLDEAIYAASSAIKLALDRLNVVTNIAKELDMEVREATGTNVLSSTVGDLRLRTYVVKAVIR